MATLPALLSTVVPFLPKSVTPEKADQSGNAPSDARPISQKDFQWDNIIKYVATAIFGITLLDVSTEFFRGSRGVVCFTPYENGTFTRDQASYINGFCTQMLPFSEYYSYFLIIQAFLLLAPRFFWGSLFKGEFNHFFDLIRKIDRLTDPDTGEYSEKNFNIVSKLEKEYLLRDRNIYSYYIAMLLVQLLIATSTVAVSEVIFIDFSTSFECPPIMPFPDDWPLDISVLCTFQTLRFTLVLRYLDYGLIGTAVLATLYGFLWCLSRHKAQLGSKQIALFAFTTGLSPDSYIFPNLFTSRQRSFADRLSTLFVPNFRSDLDFLIARLFKSDAGLAAVFKNVQIYRHIKYYKDNDRELLRVYMETQRYQHFGSLYQRKKAPRRKATASSDVAMHRFFWKVGTDASSLPKIFYDRLQQNPGHAADFMQFYDRKLSNVTLLKWHGRLFQSIRDCFFAYPLLATDNQFALDISFGTRGYNLELARVFRKVLSLKFDPAFRNDEMVVYQDTFAAQFTTIKVVEDVFSRDDSEKFDEAVASVFGLAPKCPKMKKTSRVSVSQTAAGTLQLKEETEEVDDSGDETPLIAALKSSVHGLEVVDRSSAEEEEEVEDGTTKSTADVKRINFIVVGPIMDPTKLVSANILLEKLNTPYPGPYLIEDDAILLAVRPLFIERKDVSGVFHKYKPPEWLFRHVDIESELGIDLRDKQQQETFDANIRSKLKRVGDGRGFPIRCGDTHTIFEFSTYKFDREASFHYRASDPARILKDEKSEDIAVRVRDSGGAEGNDLPLIECESTV